MEWTELPSAIVSLVSSCHIELRIECQGSMADDPGVIRGTQTFSTTAYCSIEGRAYRQLSLPGRRAGKVGVKGFVYIDLRA